MTVSELYRALSSLIPSELSCTWDNDGEMCIPSPDRQVQKVLVALDVTDETVKAAISGSFDVMITHHPLLFRPVKHLTPAAPVPRKCIELLRADVALLSFHTRLDSVTGGVNDALAEVLELTDIVPMGEEGMGRIGTLQAPMEASAFAALVADRLGASAVTLSDAGRPVQRVAVLGGAGGDELSDALRSGADTYVTGEASHHHLLDAREMGLNLLVAGHYGTEAPVLPRLANLISSVAPDAEITVLESYPIKTITK